MEMQTKYCGEISFSADEIFQFPDGLFGFETYHNFLLIRLENDANSPFFLQSTDEPSLAFILLDPFLLTNYAFDLSDADCARLGEPQEEDLAIYAICALREQIADSTVNLRSPIVLNVNKHIGCQIVLDSSSGYAFRTKLHEFTAQEGDTSC